MTRSRRNDDPMRVVAAVLFVLLALIDSPVHANIIADLVGLGGDSGKLAKLEFRLKYSFYVTSVAWSPDGKWIATSSSQGRRVHVWDVQKRAVIKELILGAADPYFHDLSWSPDSRYLAACEGFGGLLRVYNTNDWSAAHEFDREDARGCRLAAFSSDGRQIAILGRNLEVASVGDWQRIKLSNLSKGWGLAHQFHAIAYLPGTYTILIGGSQFHNVSKTAKYEGRSAGHVWFLRADEVEPSRNIQAYLTDDKGGADVMSLAISPDGQQLATGTMTGAGNPANGLVTQSIHMFNLSDGRLLAAPLDGDIKFGQQIGLTYSADGRVLIAGHEETQTKAIHIIDARTYAMVDVVHASGAVCDLAVDRTSTRFAAATNKEVIVWSLPEPR
jgi:WD40 repeat protein